MKKTAAKKTTKKFGPKKSSKRVIGDPKANVVEAALAAFAHEVRTPLTGILAISSLLATSDLNDRERRWVETIKTGAEHLAALATLFVDAARPQQSQQARQDFFNVRALAQAAGDALAGRAAAKGLQSRVDVADDLPAFMVGDPVRLRTALENLIDNAVKFTDSGEVSLKVMIAATKAGAGQKNSNAGKINFEIADSGIGLKPAEIKRLFRPFSQANVSIASRFGGAGLGLSSVRQLARAMGGDVEVKSRDGGGAIFTLTVTLKRASHPATDEALADEAARSIGRTLHILSVEDNPFGRVVLNAILTELGHKAEFIDRGELALKRLEKGRYDAVLMDMVLPGIGGIEAIKSIRKLESPQGSVAIVGVSGRAEDEAAARAAGADAFLVKPVIPRALATALLLAVDQAATATS